jgi:hypothetical protein
MPIRPLAESVPVAVAFDLAPMNRGWALEVVAE